MDKGNATSTNSPKGQSKPRGTPKHTVWPGSKRLNPDGTVTFVDSRTGKEVTRKQTW